MQGSGRHGHDKYNPEADGRISHEFAAAAYRFGHSQIGQTLSILDADGNPMDVPMYDAFLNPTNAEEVFQADMDHDGVADVSGAAALSALAQYGYTPTPGYAQHGVANILGGLLSQASEEVDLQVVDGVRNDLVRISADLFAFNAARGRDVGLGTMNQVKADLAASADPYVSEAIALSDMDMTPYASWDDFQARNGLSDDMIAKFKAAYPDLKLETAEAIAAFQMVNPDIALIDNNDGTMTVQGIDRVDLWVGGLAEAHIQGGVVGHTFWVIIHEQLDRLQESDRFYYTDRIGELPVYNNFIANITMGDIVARNTGLTDVPLDAFSYLPDHEEGAAAEAAAELATSSMETTTEATQTQQPDAQETEQQEAAAQETAAQQAEAPQGDDAETETAETAEDNTATNAAAETNAADDAETEADAEDDAETEADAEDDDAAEAPEHKVLVATGVEALIAGAGNDVLRGGAGSDFLMAGDGADIMMGGACNDDLIAGEGDDMVYGDAGNDRIFADGGNDTIVGGSGADMAYGGEGDDTFIGTDGDGNDIYYGGAGTDTIDLSAITEALEIRLGNAGTERGSVTGASQSDVIWGFENAIGGAGDDKIVASEAANILDGGAGNDTFVFETATAANGTMIKGFAAGDLLCFSDIDADTSMDGHQGFTFKTPASLADSDVGLQLGELTFSHGSEDGAAVTTVMGMTNDGQFEVKLSGHVNLEEESFLL